MVSLKNPERFFGRFWRQSNCSGICGPFPALLIRRSMGSSRMQGSVPRRLKVRSGIFANIEYVCVPCRIWRRCCPAAAPSPPGSSRRAGGYSPVLRLTADEMSLPLFPCPKKFTFWDTTLLPRGTFWVRVPRRPARGRPKAVFLLLACCTQEEDAGPATFTAAFLVAALFGALFVLEGTCAFTASFARPTAAFASRSCCRM